MLEFKEAIELLEKSDEYKNWKNENPEDYLSYALYVLSEEEIDWKIGYCNPETNEITSFTVGQDVKLSDHDKALQKEKQKIEGIDVAKVKVKMEEAVAIAKELQQEEFSKEIPKKILAILQNVNKEQVWNITFLTQTFNTLNIKIKSDNGKIVEKKLSPLFKFDEGE